MTTRIPTRTYDYIIRVSELGERDEDQTVTIPEQHERCRAEIERQHGRVGRALDAVDVSGGVVIDSDAYQLALQRVQQGTTAGIVVAYSSRFARNVWAVGRYLEALKLAGGELWFCDRPDIDYRTPSGAIIVSIDAVMNDNYLQECKSKAEATIQRNIIERGIVNVVPYGYRRDPAADDSKAIIPDETAPIVRRIFTERLDGRSWSSIARQLTADSIPTPRGGVAWSVPTVRNIVSNETYVGTAKYQRRTYRKGERTGEVVRHENAHEPLVSRAVWKAAQSSETVQRTGKLVAGITGRLAVCPSCGGKLSVAGSEPHLTYGCRRQRNGGKCPAPVYITKRIVDDVVEAAVRGALQGRIGTTPETRIGELVAVEAQAREELERFVEIASAIDQTVFENGLAQRQGRLDAASTERQQEEDRIGVATSLPSAEAFEQLSVDDRRRVAAVLIREVRISPAGGPPRDRITVVWR
jgi:DNA invertase Pin-like site-specific DNA recombinase